LQQRIGTVCMIVTKGGQVIELEIGFAEVAEHMRFADLMELPINGTL
jgi:hypothetical protein